MKSRDDDHPHRCRGATPLMAPSNIVLLILFGGACAFTYPPTRSSSVVYPRSKPVSQGLLPGRHARSSHLPPYKHQQRVREESYVTLHLFRDFLRKVRGKGEAKPDEEKDEEMAPKEETPIPPASQLVKDEGDVAPPPFFAEVAKQDSVDEQETKSLGTAVDVEAEEVVEATSSVNDEADRISQSTTTDQKEGEAEGGENVTSIVKDLSTAAFETPQSSEVDKEQPEQQIAIVQEEPASVKTISSTTTPTESLAKDTSPSTAVSQAEALRQQARRARLEADRMEAMLTLEKITKFEKELGSDAIQKDPDRMEFVQSQIKQLQRKLKGEEVAPAATPKASDGVKGSSLVAATARLEEKDERGAKGSEPTEFVPSALATEELEQRVKKFQASPKFLWTIIAKTAGYDVKDVDSLNATKLVVKLHEDEQEYLSIRSTQAAPALKQGSVPVFTQEQIEEKIEEIQRLPTFLRRENDTVLALKVLAEEWEEKKDMPTFTEDQVNEKVGELRDLPQFVRNIYRDQGYNDTSIALFLLEEEWKESQSRQKMQEFWGGALGKGGTGDKRADGADKSSGQDDGFGLFGIGKTNEFQSDLATMVESQFPKTTRKEGEAPSEAQVNILIDDVLVKTRAFSPLGKPEPVPGGFIVRGINNCDNGDELISSIDASLARSRVRDKLSVFFIKDPIPDTDNLSPEEWPSVLFVAGSNVARDSAPVLLSIVSAFGIGSTWYLSLYPFLLNDKFLARAEEQLSLAEASMPSDLSFLSAMAVPIFLTFFALQVTHELAHQAVAASNGFNVTVPTLVPSLVSGITSSVTSLKSSPKNKKGLFDFALAGPLTGMASSVAVLSFGLLLTANMDSASYANLPGLPLDLLRQSSLAGGIIDLFLGPGVLDVPASAASSRAVADISIPLHPLAIAGFFSLLVNAVSLLPFGRTDGGRISMALFGRSGAQAAGFVSLIAAFVVGLMSSDLLLFYVSFVLFFQSELEIPMRNEVDDVDFSRVLLATFTGVLVLLTLIPM